MRQSAVVALVLLAFGTGVALGGFALATPRSVPAGTTTYVTSTVTATVTTTLSAPGEPLRALCFSPDGGCANVLIAWLDQARASIHVMVYVFTSDAIADALIRAHQQGVEVLVVVERSEATTSGSEVARLQDAGIEVRLDDNAALMHHKVAIVDQAVVATGSYNWSAAAEERNNENLLVLADTNAAAQYEEAQRRLREVEEGLGALERLEPPASLSALPIKEMSHD